MRFVRKVTERGTVTLPIEVREALGVEEGDIVELEILRTTKASALRKGRNGPSPGSALLQANNSQSGQGAPRTETPSVKT